jgi:hypothetical protein
VKEGVVRKFPSLNCIAGTPLMIDVAHSGFPVPAFVAFLAFPLLSFQVAILDPDENVMLD